MLPLSDGQPKPDPIRSGIIEAGRRYWAGQESLLSAMAAETLSVWPSRRYDGHVEVALPEWAKDLGVGSAATLLVDARAVTPGDSHAFERCDWWLAAALMLWSAAEREHEAAHGPLHSYAFRAGIDQRAYDRAWVNRILLLLRRAAARQVGSSENAIFGPRPRSEIVLTLDLDAVSRLIELRFKQSAFQAVNAARSLLRGKAGASLRRLRAAAGAWTAPADLWTLDELRRDLASRAVSARMYVYAGPAGWSRDWGGRLMDPGYDAGSLRLSSFLQGFLQDGHEIGLHPSFASWHSADMIGHQRSRLSDVLGNPVVACRQHWLRFSFDKTWAAQAKAGLQLDSTLGFNDRWGFRNSAALRFTPVDPATMSRLPIEAEPMVLMDSHLYDYDLEAAEAPEATINRCIDEIDAVGGEATVLWHPHTLHPSIGWGKGFAHLLARMERR